MPPRILIKRSGTRSDWIPTKDLDKRSTFGSAGGFVYVAVVPGEDGYKIGKTNKCVAERVKRDAFSRKSPKVIMSLEVANASMAEKQVHDALSLYRTPRTEFFKVPAKELEHVLSELASKRVKLWTKSYERVSGRSKD